MQIESALWIFKIANAWIAKAIWAQGMTRCLCVCLSVELQFIFKWSNQDPGRSLVCVAFVFLHIPCKPLPVTWITSSRYCNPKGLGEWPYSSSRLEGNLPLQAVQEEDHHDVCGEWRHPVTGRSYLVYFMCLEGEQLCTVAGTIPQQLYTYVGIL